MTTNQMKNTGEIILKVVDGKAAWHFIPSKEAAGKRIDI